MQSIAREFNLSETVFLLSADGEGDALARIFTPRVELPFAGHPVLGSGAVLAWTLKRDEIQLLTGAGKVPVEVTRNQGWSAFGRMQQPIPRWQPFGETEELLAALGASATRLPIDRRQEMLGPDGLIVRTARLALCLEPAARIRRAVTRGED